MSEPTGEIPSQEPQEESEVDKQQAASRAREAWEYIKGLFRRERSTTRPVEEPSHEPQTGDKQQQPESPTPPEPPQRQPSPDFDRQNAREMQQLTEFETPDLRVLPGDHWAMHYPNGPEARAGAVDRLFAGGANPSAEVANVTPDALFYDQKDLDPKRMGFPQVRNRVYDTRTAHENFDYNRFTDFISEMHGTNMDADFAQRLYNTLAGDRISHDMLDTYHGTDRARVIDSVRAGMHMLPAQMQHLQGMERILAASRMHALTYRHNFVPGTIQSAVESALDGKDAAIYKNLRDTYKNYVDTNDQASYEAIVRAVQEYYHQEQQQDSQPPPEPALPPESNDYQPPSEEDKESRKFYEVKPSGASTEPELGYYPRVKQSFFDKVKRSWINIDVRQDYTFAAAGDQRQTITNIPPINDAELHAIPVPDGFILDAASFHITGTDAKLLQDHNGRFFVQGKDVGKFTVDFVPSEKPLDIPLTQPTDTEIIHTGQLSGDAENFIEQMKVGTFPPTDVADKLKAFINERHVYPGAEELQALQDNMLNSSTPDNYIQAMENSPLLDCYLGNTLAVDMLRASGVSARFVKGEKIDQVTDGKAVIDSSTGHAWAEVWDGDKWLLYDFTPDSPSDAAKEEEGEDGAPKPGGGGDEDVDATDTSDDDHSEGGKPKPGDGGDKDDDTKDKTEENEGDEGKPKPGGEGSADGDTTETSTEVIRTDQLPQDSASDDEQQQGDRDLEAAREAIQEARRKQQEMQEKMQDIESFGDAEALKDLIDGDDELFRDMQEQLQDMIDARGSQMKDTLREQIEQMMEEGFLDEEQNDALQEILNQSADPGELDNVLEQIAEEKKLFDEFQQIREDIEPLVDEWFEYFVSKLPREDMVDRDEDITGRRGRVNVNALMQPHKYLTGKVFNPRVVRPEIRAKFLASIVVDVSPSMIMDDAGNLDPTKLLNARKLTVFYNELFSRISEQYGYIKYANYAFSDNFRTIKRYDQEYNSAKRYGYEKDESATVKKRLMEIMSQVEGGTDILQALHLAAGDLNEIKDKFGDYVSTMYFFGDGGDTKGNEDKIRAFLQKVDDTGGFGDHNRHATMIGNEELRQVLAELFGDSNTAVAPDFESLVEKSMEQFEEDMEEFLRGKVA